MADFSSRKIKCIRFQMRKSTLWIWVFIIECLLSLPCVFSQCLGVDTSVAIYPPGEISVEYGQPLEIFCVTEKYSSSDIQFISGGHHLKSEIVNRTTIKLYIEKPEKQSSTYYCYNNKTKKKCVSRIFVESAPTYISDFICISYNLETLSCSWTGLDSHSIINYSLAFSINNNLRTPPCNAKRDTSLRNNKRYTCTWNTNSRPRYIQQEEKQYFYLTACNVFGCNSQNFTIDHFSIVKPDPPYKLQLIKNGPHSADLTWSIPNNMADLLYCGIDHIIEYQIAKIDNTTQFHRVNSSFLPPKNRTYRFQLANLPYAHMQYEVRVFIKSKKAVKREFWSDFSYVVFYTASESPKRPPETIAGAFHKKAYSNYRKMYVYWKQLEEFEEAGMNFTYKVLVSQGNKTQTVYPDKNKSLSYVRLNANLNALDITVWSINDKGSSLNISHLYIPAEKDTNALVVTAFTTFLHENGTYELSWDAIKNVDDYTLFWCQNKAAQICVGRMDFAVLDAKKINHVIDLPREYRYQFAIAANNGSKTSGMVWANCDISKDGFVMYGFPVHLTYDVPGKTFVTLRLFMDCALQDGIITGYNITYCPIVQTSSNCDKSFNNSYKFISNPKQMEVTIENLFPFRTYQFTIALNTIYGQKTIDNATAVITTSEDTPTNPVNISISDIRNTSLVISWDPPIHKNGNIGKYVIYNYDKEIYVDNVSGTDTSHRQVTITGLQGFSNYSLTVQACNIPIGLCSKIRSNDSVSVTTKIGSPSRLRAPTVKNNPNKLHWKPPEIPGGRVDLYEIQRIKDDSLPESINTTELSFSVEYCVGVVSSETYQVRAVNFDVPVYNKGHHESPIAYVGPWSEPSTVACRSKDGLTMIFIFMAVFSLIAIAYGSIKLYKKYRKMEDIKPVLPSGLGIPEKDISKYTFGNWNPTTKEEKPPSDEMLLLPNGKTTVSSTDTKQKDDNCAASEHTDSTALSDSSRIPIDRQASTSEESSETSVNLEPVSEKGDESNEIQEEESSSSDTESSPGNSPYFGDKAFKKNPTSGYVQPVVNPSTGYVQSAPAPVSNKLPPNAGAQAASNSYVMAGLPPPVFASNAGAVTNPPTLSSGYVLAEEAQARFMMNANKLGPSHPKTVGQESLPTMPSLPPPAKQSADNSYIQLQSLDSLPSLKLSERNTFSTKQPTNGYVSSADVVINKHLNNILTAGQHTEESAILDPTMSPDAYCRFSWSTDPANDNLNTLLSDSPSRTYKN